MLCLSSGIVERKTKTIDAHPEAYKPSKKTLLALFCLWFGNHGLNHDKEPFILHEYTEF